MAAALGNKKDPLQAQSSPDIVFLFPGQGAQYPGMAAGLYAAEPFPCGSRRMLRQSASLIFRRISSTLICSGKSEDADLLRSTENAQPALFIVEYALARLWMSWGIEPAAMIGHSVGEITAACLAGVFSLQDAFKLVALRGRMMQRMESGSMLSVRMSAADLAPYLQRHKLSLASVNSPSSLRGSPARIRGLQISRQNLLRRISRPGSFTPRMPSTPTWWMGSCRS